MNDRTIRRRLPGTADVRHSRASTTLDIYQQFVPESQRRAVDTLGKMGKPDVVN